jgi:hypothetical protein
LRYRDQASDTFLRDLPLPTLSESGVNFTFLVNASKPCVRIIDLTLSFSIGADLQPVEMTRTLEITFSAPFIAHSGVRYHHATTKPGEEVDGWATVTTLLSAPGPSRLSVEKLELDCLVG